MELTSHDKKIIQKYISAFSEHRNPEDVLSDCRTSVVTLMQSILIEEYKYAPTSTDLKEPAKCFFESDFIEKKIGSKREPRSQELLNIKNQMSIVLQNRNFKQYSTDDDNEKLEELAKQSKSALTVICRWFFSKHKKFQLSLVTNLSFDDKEAVKHLFYVKIDKKEKDVIEREYYYVILLIDSSQSMLWPYLKDQRNYDKEDSSDYKEAVSVVQKAMQVAHEKALTALRGSSICKGDNNCTGYMMIYQYTFNHRKKLLNPPEELSSVGLDKVAKISKINYYPEGRTALYDVIDESIKVIYDNYLKKAMDEEKRIDKVAIGVITDGEDTVITDAHQKASKISEIRKYLNILRGQGDLSKCFLVSSVLIGLTGTDFSESKLKEIKSELTFDEIISINQSDEHSIRQAFKLFSTNAINV
ncbi:MAG: VWA domain-containing protein [Melioribacteraceae bacterium]|nr:VWA domain-containing protein [Melioribacteraceae bacterium]